MKKKKIILVIFLISLVLILPGAVYYKIQFFKLTYIYTYFQKLDDDYITQNQKKIDVTKYDLSFDLYPEKKMFSAKAIITGKVLDPSIQFIDLNFYDIFQINKITLNGDSVKYENEGTRLTISINTEIISDFEIVVDYEGTPKKAGLEGFVFGKRNGTSLVYNLSEPNYASTWFPCNDIPFDKTNLEVKITNDTSMVSVSNGVLVNVATNGSRKTYHWKTEYPTGASPLMGATSVPGAGVRDRSVAGRPPGGLFSSMLASGGSAYRLGDTSPLWCNPTRIGCGP